MILAILLFISGIAISIVAEYYSIMGLMAIFSAAPIPIAATGPVPASPAVIVTVEKV